MKINIFNNLHSSSENGDYIIMLKEKLSIKIIMTIKELAEYYKGEFYMTTNENILIYFKTYDQVKFFALNLKLEYEDIF